jgi:glycosyltransferase involved in cell wall biosynthesis
MSGYAGACFGALRDAGAEVLLVHRAATRDAPYEDSGIEVGVDTERWVAKPAERALRRRVEAFAPDVLLLCSWDVGAYRRIGRAMAGRTLRVLFMDNPWRGTAKQWAGRLSSPLVVRPMCDAAFLPGERAADFALRLGIPSDRILRGAYTCDHDRFAAVARSRTAGPEHAFAFVGRLVADKGVDVLAEAYREYRAASADPWPLTVCGTGPQAALLAGIPGVDVRGFVQPADLPAVFAGAGCLVLPSRFEPWGVVVHEAAAAGLAVIASTACEASTRLVVDGYNGAVVPPSDPGALALAMARVAGGDLAAMGAASSELARQFTPARWAAYFLERAAELRPRLGLPPA